ncbi:MAG: HAMP domain-containing histidine kinase, partial [candidate division WOR-3 bacterium]
MKVRGLILIFIFASAIIFTYLTVRVTNNSLERTFRDSSQNAFYLLSFVVDNLFQYEKEIEVTTIERLRHRVNTTGTGTERLLGLERDESIQGIWVIDETGVAGTTDYGATERQIINFYQTNLKGKNAHTLIFLARKPFFLVNTTVGAAEVLVLSNASDVYGLKIEQVLDSLVVSSNLRYFAIIDSANTPLLFSTIYENFLPLRGQGYHIIRTPGGKIFQIEESVANNRVVAGFEMESLQGIIRRNNFFLLMVVLGFVVLEGILFIGFLRFDRFRIKKEREINRLKEISALSTGFAHEFRNSLHTLSLLARSMDKDNKSIILDETERMKTIMNSLRLLGTTEIKREEVIPAELVSEALSLLNHAIQESAATVKVNAEPGLVSHGNRSLLVTAISNIIKNSLEAGAKNIEIGVSGKGKETTFQCTDDGKGIHPSAIDEIFVPFFSKKGQSGIGLYLTKRIVELHGGTIKVESNGH